MGRQETLAHKVPVPAFEWEKARPRQIAREPWEDGEEYELMAVGVGIRGSCGVGQVQEDDRKGVVDSSLEGTAAESCGRKGLNIEQGQGEGDRDSKEPGGERRDTRNHSGKQDNTCKE